MNFAAIISQQLNIEEWRVAKAVELMDEGGTVPFIARYRKDQTGTLDEIQLRDIQHGLEYHRELDERKTTVLKSIEEQGKLSPELKAQIIGCLDKTLLEDIYAPYKPKKRTRATIAKECGLEPLARIIEAQEPTSNTAEEIGRIYLSEEKGLADPIAAVQMACDILAEELADRTECRQYLRARIEKEGIMVSKVRKEFETQETKFKNYYEFSEPLSKMPSHRVLAIRRGEKEKVLRISMDMPDENYVGYLQTLVVKATTVWKPFLDAMCKDSYDRLLKPSLETEVRLLMKERAELEAFTVFSKNLRDILLASPAGHKAVLALDPGFRSGVKVAVMDENGKFLDHCVIYPHEPQKDIAGSKKKVKELVAKYGIQLIAIGNGTAGRETDAFIAEFIADLKPRPVKVIVNESGASVYSASMIAIEEFPKEDVTTRGAISIGRRLQDPLAELVKVDPKAIGVGQYQHDVNQKELQKRLDEVVESCVNMVGVDLNSASESLLGYVAGISKSLAHSILEYRNEHGAFKGRQEVMKIKGFGPKAFEQAAGFLRIPDAENPLDCSAVHPENYGLVEKIASKNSLTVKELLGNMSVLKSVKAEEFIDDKVGKHTLADIISEIEKPNRDPRKEFTYATFSDKIQNIQDLITGSWLEGVVTNVTNFGAFVDIGVHQDGLIHISEISQTFVKDAKLALTVGDVVKVRVLAVDVQNKRISLSAKPEVAEGNAGGAQRGQDQRGQHGGHGGHGGARGERGGRDNRDNRGQQQGGRGDHRGPQGGPQGGQQGRDQQRGNGPTQGHATIADLKNMLAGKNPGGKKDEKKAQHVKLSVSLASLMKGGR
jgi:uncharacterized protein